MSRLAAAREDLDDDHVAASALAGDALMLNAIETYLTLRRATGFAMQNEEYLLKSFAAFAAERGQTHVHTQTAI